MTPRVFFLNDENSDWFSIFEKPILAFPRSERVLVIFG